jgi:hypothetical protein
MRDYLADFLTSDVDEVLDIPHVGKYQKYQKPPATFEKSYTGQVSKVSKGTFDTFDTSPHGTYPKLQEAFVGFVRAPSQEHLGFLPLPLTTDRIQACRQKWHPAQEAEENIEVHDSALFDVVVEVDFHDGRQIRIPQQSTPAGWSAPF